MNDSGIYPEWETSLNDTGSRINRLCMIDPKEPLAPDNDIAEESTLPAPAEAELDAAFAEDESEDDE